MAFTRSVRFASFTTQLKPVSANRYWRHSGRGVYVSAEAKEYKKKLAEEATEAGIAPVEGADVRMKIYYYHTGTRQDVDNIIKVLCDALKGIAYTDDSAIQCVTAERWLDKKAPRVTVEIEWTWGNV